MFDLLLYIDFLALSRHLRIFFGTSMHIYLDANNTDSGKSRKDMKIKTKLQFVLFESSVVLLILLAIAIIAILFYFIMKAIKTDKAKMSSKTASMHKQFTRGLVVQVEDGRNIQDIMFQFLVPISTISVPIGFMAFLAINDQLDNRCKSFLRLIENYF